MPARSFQLVVCLMLLSLVAACGGSGSSSGSDNEPAMDRYALANQCFALQSSATKQYATRDDQGNYVAVANGAGPATGFYMKPTALGRYMFYTPEQTLLVAKGDGSVGELDAPRNATGWGVDAAAEWTIKRGTGEHFTVVSSDTGMGLMVDPRTKRLTQTPTSDGELPPQFDFARAEGCAEFPEIGTQTTGKTFKGTGADEPVLGFADIHNHISATDFLGGDHVGRPFDKFGVTEALGDGTYMHGERGRADLVGNLYGGTPAAQHDPQGWPTFIDWPARDMLTHEGTYYRWIKRAWKAGLRVLNNNVVENQVLCTLQSVAQNGNLSDIDLQKVIDGVRGATGEFGKRCQSMDNTVGPDTDSSGPHEVVGGQIAFMRRMENYIDAQNGGPGEGWFRIVESPAEAREVINQGKLAVYLGIEHSHLFGCSYRHLRDTATCTKDDIDEQLDDIYEKGVRQVNMTHEFNNGLGGNGIFNDLILNVGNFVDTGGFWETEDCTAIDADYIPSDTDDFLFAPGSNLVSLTNLGGVLPDNPLSGLLNGLLSNSVVALPAYPAEVRQCNKRGITDLGRYAIEKIMDKGMLIDVDHMSLKMKSQVINIAKKRDYPLISTHSGHGGISNQQAREIFKLGGLIYPIGHNAEARVGELNRIKPLHEQAMAEHSGEPFDFAMGYGADTNGLAKQPTKQSDDAKPVAYPFTLFQGPEWGPQFDRVSAVTFEQSAVPEGERRFSLPEEGVAQYGLFADLVKSTEIDGGEESLDALFNSAEVFLQTWQRARDAGARTKSDQ